MRKATYAVTKSKTERLLMDKARLAAFNAVKRIFGGAYSNLIDFGDELSGLDRAFAESIALGTSERKIALEFVLDDNVKSDTKRELYYLLMTGLYQILYMDRVPDSAACDETVNIAKSIFGTKNAGFVNAVLRSICRRKNDIIEKILNAEPYIKYSVNKSLFELIESQYPQDAERIFDAFFKKSDMCLRINNLKCKADDIANQLNGYKLNEKAVVCSDPQKAIASIESGNYYVQGLASQKAVELLSAQSGQTVIDVCACPGGKSLGVAIDMKNQGKVLSFDIHKNKLPLIQKSAQRLGISIIETDVLDARSTKTDLIGIADRVICDVPCSGTGVMGSKPEIKYKSPDEFKGLYPTQKAIIKSSSKYLKIGGMMVYSTCSINKSENEAVVEHFISENKGYKLISQETCLPFGEEKEGFFMAKIVREF